MYGIGAVEDSGKVKYTKKICMAKGCGAKWDSLGTDPTQYCFIHKHLEGTCQTKVTKEKTEKSGMTAPGDQKSQLTKENLPSTPHIGQKLIEKKKGQEVGIVDRILQEKKESVSEHKNVQPTIKIETKSIGSEQKEQEEIQSTKTKDSESTMQKTERDYVPKLSKEGMSEIPPSDLSRPLEIIKTEQLGAMKLLNDSAQHLYGVALSLATPVTIDEEGFVLKRAASQDINLSISCLGELNNIMRTKLEYLRFAKDISK